MNEQELEKKLSRLKNIEPSEKLVNKITSDYQQSIKGRISFIELTFNQIHNLMKWKIVVPLVVVVLAIIIFGGAYVMDYQNSKTYSPNSGAGKVVVPNPAPTEDIDGVIDAVFDFSAAESDLFGDEENDAALIDMDNKAINDFGQSYNENEL